MFRKIILGLFVFLLLLSVAAFFYLRHLNTQFFRDTPNHLAYAKDTSDIRFQWAKQQYGDYVERHTAMVIPSSIPGTSYKFFFQLDTGSPHSYIYGKTLDSFRAAGVSIGSDTLSGKYLKYFNISLGGSHVEFENIRVMENYGVEVTLNDTTSSIMLGTIGADFLDDKITSIDFKDQKIQFFEERPLWMKGINSFEDFDFRGRRFMLPVILDGKELVLFYDSGCSAFGLITSKNRYRKYGTLDVKEVSYQGKRWGDDLPIFHKESSSVLHLGGNDVPLRRVSYVGMFGDFQRFMTPFTTIGGFLGNKPFLDHTLILDTQKEQFAVVDSLFQR